MRLYAIASLLFSSCAAPVATPEDEAKLFGAAAPGSSTLELILGTGYVEQAQPSGAPTFSAGDVFAVRDLVFDASGREIAEAGISTDDLPGASAYDSSGQSRTAACDLRRDGTLTLRAFDGTQATALFQFSADSLSFDFWNYNRPAQCESGVLLALPWAATYERFLDGIDRRHDSEPELASAAFVKRDALGESGRYQVMLARRDGYTDMLQGIVGIAPGQSCMLTPRDRLLIVASYTTAVGDTVHIALLDWGSIDAHNARRRQSGDCFAHNYYWVPAAALEEANTSVITDRLGGTTTSHPRYMVGEVIIGESYREHIAVDPHTGAADTCSLRVGGRLSLTSFSADGSLVVSSYRQSEERLSLLQSLSAESECQNGALVLSAHRDGQSLWDATVGLFYLR